jgi:hypothetical protein
MSDGSPRQGGRKVPARFAIGAHAPVADLPLEIADFARAAGTAKVERGFVALGFIELEKEYDPAAQDERG